MKAHYTRVGIDDETAAHRWRLKQAVELIAEAGMAGELLAEFEQAHGRNATSTAELARWCANRSEDAA